MTPDEAKKMIVQRLRERFGGGAGFHLDPVVASEPIITPVTALQETFEPARPSKSVQILDETLRGLPEPEPEPTNLLLGPIPPEPEPQPQPNPAAVPTQPRPNPAAIQPRPDLARHLLTD